MERRRITMMLDIQQVALKSLCPMTSVEPADICQIRQPMMLLTYSATTSQRFLSIQSSMHLEDKVLNPIFDAQFHSSPTRTCMCERSGLTPEERLDWTVGNWMAVNFSDESIFHLFGSDGMEIGRASCRERV